MSLITRFSNAVQAFFATPTPEASASWIDGRQARYQRNWAWYTNTSYANLGAFLSAWDRNQKLYKYVRGVTNPVPRYVEFYTAAIWGGALDYQADATGAIPIITDNKNLRAAIAKGWQWSNWAAKKVLATRYGAALGDCIIEVIDMPTTGKAYLQNVYPGDVDDIIWDDFGNIKKIEFKAARYEVVNDLPQSYEYKKIIEHPSIHKQEGHETEARFRTFKNGAPYAYFEDNGVPVYEWYTPYDFIPVVHAPHVDKGMGWGDTGFSPVERKIAEADAIASQLSDQLSKSLNVPLAAFGVRDGSVKLSTEPGHLPVIYLPKDAKIDQVIYNMDMASGLELLSSILSTIKEDLPELSLRDAIRSGLSGEALGIMYSDVVKQITSVRSNYDAALVRAQQMMVAIAGERKYAPEFASFNIDSYQRGLLDHQIGDRPVLPRSQKEEIDLLKTKWEVTKLASEMVGEEYALQTIMDYTPQMIADAQDSANQSLADTIPPVGQ